MNVQEAHEKGAVLYLLDMFCNNDTPGLRERTAEVSHTYVLFLIFHPFKSFTYNTDPHTGSTDPDADSEHSLPEHKTHTVQTCN
jgi:hypothetical protein